MRSPPLPSPARLLRVAAATRDGDLAWIAPLPDWARPGDGDPRASGLRLFEEGIEIGPAHTLHDEIRTRGGGRFSHWGGRLWFSTTDGSDPHANGRTYLALVPRGGSGPVEALLARMPDHPEELPEEHRLALVSSVAEILSPGMILPDHGRLIERDAGFMADFLRFLPRRNTTIDRKYAVSELARHIARVDGDVAEAGCYNGATAFFLARRIAETGGGRLLHLYDSFQGLSVPAPIDGAHWTAGALVCERTTVERNLAGFPFVRCHEGWIPDCFADTRDRTFAFVHIDVDLHAPTLAALEFFYERLTPGGMVVLDDYGFATCPGVTAAVDGFLSGRPEILVNLPSGGAWFVKERG